MLLLFCGLGLKLGLVVRKCLALLGIESSEDRWSSNFKSISEVKGYSDWNCNPPPPPLVNQRRLLYWCGDAWKEHLSLKFVQVLLQSGIYSGSCTDTQVTNVSPGGLSLGGIPEGYSDCILRGIRGKWGEELDVSQGCHQVYPWCIPTPSRW